MAKKTQVGIIGAGPAGMIAALQAAWQGAEVTLFDANTIVGRKLLVTGSGRCNLTNAAIAPERYVCSNPAFLAALFNQFDREALLKTLERIGILAYHTADGWYYPCSESAATVVDAFAAALAQTGVQLRLNQRVTGLKKTDAGFRVQTGESEWIGERLIVAAGGQAYPTLGSRGDLYPLLSQLGHTITPVYPALAPVQADVRTLHKLQGVRLDVTAGVWQGKTLLGTTTGNLIFTQWGFNGPAVMDLSHLISTRPGTPLQLTLNLLPGEIEPRLRTLLKRKQQDAVPIRVLLGAVLPPKVPPVILGLAGVNAEVLINQLNEAALENILKQLTCISVEIQGVRGFDYAQVSTGGVPVDEVHPTSLESKQIPGLYLAGETLDVIGPCGGFNLQFAFSSGAAAGLAAGQH
ncbi:MAG TPA: aminoacetone oxidase family FAD-binding enzyme [Anaerolineaceae bacterium]|nr:aminoacetone oxidase family FAD-binding enzyme [Anaerolineaceae bacterium]HQH85661.1 aminoacetone oxidase family FAD-binding enzyme [Anaerolineaceae bacterium]